MAMVDPGRRGPEVDIEAVREDRGSPPGPGRP